MSQILFTSTKLSMLGKEGVLKKDKDGYYTVVLGALNIFNSAGEYYVANGARQLFEKDAILMRRISNGNLKGENGHPKFPIGGKMRDYIERLMTIEETNVISHYKEVWLEEDFGKKNPRFGNPSMVGIFAKVCPSGEKAAVLQRALENPSENVNFSIRAFTRDYVEGGKTYRVLESIVTWDVVGEPGLHVANKWDSPSLENLKLVDNWSRSVSKKDLQYVSSKIPQNASMESSREMVNSLLHYYEKPLENKSVISNWT